MAQSYEYSASVHVASAEMAVGTDDYTEPLLPDSSAALLSRSSRSETRLSKIYHNLVSRPSVSIERADGQFTEQPSSFFKDKVKEKKRRLTWIQLDASGARSMLQADKRNLCQQMGLRLPVRDLRVLDPAFTTQGSGCVLVRERCIVVALEHVRIIIMKDRVLVPKGDMFSPHEANLMRALERHILDYSRPGCTLGPSQSHQSLFGLANGGHHDDKASSKWDGHDYSHDSAANGGESQSVLPKPRNSSGAGMQNPFGAFSVGPHNGSASSPPEGGACATSGRLRSCADPSSPSAPTEAYMELMPFEHSVLDCALNEVTARLSREVRELTGRAKPVVDRMTSDVRRETLLSVRDLKNEQQELHSRVEVVCEQLDALSEEKDLWRMCLTTRDEVAELRGSTPVLSTGPLRDPSVHGAGLFEGPRRSTDALPQVPHFFETAHANASFRGNTLREEWGGHAQWTEGDSQLDQRVVNAIVAADIEHVEELIEAYSIEADRARNRLESLGNHITDVEAFVNIDMDAVRNRMIKWEIVLTTASFVTGIYAVVAGILGENLPLAPHSMINEGGYILVNLGMCLLCATVFCVITYNAKRNGLL